MNTVKLEMPRIEKTLIRSVIRIQVVSLIVLTGSVVLLNVRAFQPHSSDFFSRFSTDLHIFIIVCASVILTLLLFILFNRWLIAHITALKKEAFLDALTGIGNRRYFQEQLSDCLQEALLTHGDFCLMMIDIDHFKRFNDTHGHVEGDHILSAVAQCMANVIPLPAKLARYGGEEFAILFQGDIEQAYWIAERIRRNAETVIGVTLSIGIAKYCKGDSEESLLKRTDKALYSAKNRGRNCVKVDNDVHLAVTHSMT